MLVAYNGQAALHAIRRDQPDLVLLDLMLPDQDGWDITRTVRSDPKLATLPLIMVTARVTDSDKIIGLELGADDYITKPYNPREVVARVRARLRIQQGSQRMVQRSAASCRRFTDGCGQKAGYCRRPFPRPDRH